MTTVTNPLDDSPTTGPAFKAKDLKPNDVINDHRGYPQRFRVVANSETEIQLERYEPLVTANQKRISHSSLDTAGFVHIGVMPGFFRGIFNYVVMF